jgi:type I restriction enzyme, S subunit
MIMSKWPRALLGDIAPIVRRSVKIQPHEVYTEIGVRSFFKGIFHRRVVQGSEFTWQKIFHIRRGDIVFSNLMAWEKGIGLAGSADAGCIGNHRMLTCEPDLSRVMPEFIFSYCQTPEFVANIEIASPGSIARNKTLSADSLQTIPVPVPPLETQRRIVERLEAVSTHLIARAEAAERQEAELTAMLGACCAQMIANAPRVPMAELAPLIRRPVTVVPDQSYDELGVRSFGKGTFHKPALSSLDIGNKRIFRIEPGDLIFSNVFAWEGAIAIARPEDAGRVGSHRFITCIVDQRRIAAEILRFFFLTKEGLGLIGQASPGGAGRNRTLGLEALGSIRVPVPPLEAQRWFNNLHAKVVALRTHQAAIATDAYALLPAMLAQIFG